MPRPNQRDARREELLPRVAATFAEHGYRRTTTAMLGEVCEVRENILYRLWSDKRAMFVAALDHVYEVSETAWRTLLEEDGDGLTPAQRILEYESRHLGEYGLHRLVFAGLSETDDAEIASAMRRLYRRFHRFIARQVEEHRAARPSGRGGRRSGGGSEAAGPDAAEAAWAIIGLGTVSHVGRELGLLTGPARKRLLRHAGRALLDAGASLG